MRAPLTTLLAALLLACGSPSGGDDGSTDAPDDLVDTDTRDSVDPAPDADSVDAPADDSDPPLGMCGVYCMGENRPCPDGAFCEYGILDPTFLCTDDGCGMCAWIPDECPPDDNPDCGCDGTVYANPCERRRAEALPDPSWMSCPRPEPDEEPESTPDASTD